MSGSPNTATRPADAPAPLELRVVRRKLVELKLLQKDENARFMEIAEHKQLVENLKIDGVLTSTPLVYKDEVISGNHRVEAAIEAGIVEADTLEVVGEIDPARKLALQLSHNAIAGKDDMGVLHSLYKGLDLFWKKFSGLNEEVFSSLKPVDLTSLSIGSPKYQELVILFLPEQAEVFNETLTKFYKKVVEKGLDLHMAHLDDFDRFFDAIVAVKKVRGVKNSAVALRVMAEVALAALEQEATDAAAAKAAKK